MEAKVHEELLSFLSRHSLEETVSNIDDIVLSYLVGVVELIGQGDDGLDIEELMEMMNAYLPGFEQIGRSEVIDWMFGLAARLLGHDATEPPVMTESSTQPDTADEERVTEANDRQNLEVKERKFPSYDYSEKITQDSNTTNVCVTDIHSTNNSSSDKKESKDYETKNSSPDKKECSEKDHDSIMFISSTTNKQIPQQTFTLLPLSEGQNRQSCSKRKGRQLSCSSQDSQDDSSKTDAFGVEEAQVRILLEMFPSACTMEARHCLQLSAGNMDRAAQLIIDRQDTGQAIRGQAKCKVTKKNHKVKKMDYKLDDDSIKLCVVERYSFIDTEEDKRTYRPPPPKGEAKKLVRYRDGQVVSMKGEKFSEVKKKEDEDMKPTYVSLKPARKYRFH